MSLCINPRCPRPKNPNHEKFCLSCGSELLLQERYRVIRRLGEGGFGVTYEVSDARSNISKVLKILINNQKKAVELFVQETQVLKSLNHPGIPKVDPDAYFIYFPRDTQDPIHCLVMEKIVGIDLQKWMDNRGMSPIDEDLAMRWLRELVSILEQVHNRNFFHRDIKPANIMLKADGNLTLIDFGTARQLTETYQMKVGAGQRVTGIISAGYTPSEQINGHAEPRSDFFALGRTFVYLITGKHPLDPQIYDSNNDQLYWDKNVTNISFLLVDLLDRMMASKPNQRLANTQAILKQLSEIELALKSGRYTSKLPLFRPQMQLKQTQEKFLRKWVLANTIGGTLSGIFLGWGLGIGINPTSFTYPIRIGTEINSSLIALIAGFIFGAGFGTTQWLVLKKWFYRTRFWVLATAVDAAINSVVFTFIFSKAFEFAVSENSPLTIAYAPFVGIMQYLVLRKFLPKAFWWLIATPVCMLIGSSTGSILFTLLNLFRLRGIYIPFNILPIMSLSIRFSLFGILTGGFLIWLSRSPRFKE